MDPSLEDAVAAYFDRRDEQPELTPEEFALEREEDRATLLAAVREASQLRELLEASTIEAPERIGPYRVQAEIGRGGMGIVFAVERDGQPFALKLMTLGAALTPTAIERFRREARILARLEHAGIVRIHDTGVAGGAPYLVMELVEGAPLSACEQTLDERRSLEIVRDLARAVHAAHTEGILHRDLKPQDVMEARPPCARRRPRRLSTSKKRVSTRSSSRDIGTTPD